jgi:hypothetical protein
MGSRDRAGGLSVDESKIDERTGPSEARSGNSDRAGDARVASDGAGAEKQSEGTRSAELLMGLVEGARIFRAADGRFHARVAIEGQNELIGLRSKAFRDWLVDRYVSAYRKLPPSRAVQRVLEAVEARARFDVDRPPVYVRVGRGRDENEESFYLDLGDRAGRAVRICGSGWSVVDEAGIHFSRPHGQLPLPVPSHDGSIELLKPFVNVSPSDFHLLITWLAAALRPAGPYPVLAIRGEQGSAKSTLAKVVRQLVDPQSAPLLGEPGSADDLMVTALNGWLLAYDNLGILSSRLSDSLCRLASGGGIARRALYTNQERNLLYGQRPIVVNGIGEIVRKCDLADRCVFLHLPSIAGTRRRAEDDFWGEFQKAQPRILGGLLDVVVGALRELPSIRLAELPRMADFARFGEAVSRGAGWPAGTFLSAYQENRKDATVSSLEASALGTLLLRYAEQYGSFDCTWTATEMHTEFSREVGKKVATSARWPKTPSTLGSELSRLAPLLREHGINVSFSRTSASRSIRIATGLPSAAAS